MFSNENKMQRNWFSDWYLRLLFWILMECHCDNIYLQIHFGVIFTIVCTYKNMHFQLISVESWMRVDTVNVCIWHFVWIFLVFILWFVKMEFFSIGQIISIVIFLVFAWKSVGSCQIINIKFKCQKMPFKDAFHFRAICYCFDIYLS